MKRRNSPIRSRISDGGRDQFSELKEKMVRIANAHFAGGAHGLAQRLDAAPMPLPARQPARRRPAAVAIHDDGDVPRHRRTAGQWELDCWAMATTDQTVMISFSLVAQQLIDVGDRLIGRLLDIGRPSACDRPG